MDLVLEPGTHLKEKTVFSTSNMIRLFNFSPIDERDEEIGYFKFEMAAMKLEIAEIKKILSDGSVSESGSVCKFTIVS